MPLYLINPSQYITAPAKVPKITTQNLMAFRRVRSLSVSAGLLYVDMAISSQAKVLTPEIRSLWILSVVGNLNIWRQEVVLSGLPVIRPRPANRAVTRPKIVWLNHQGLLMRRCLLAFVLLWCLPGSSQVSPAAARIDVVQYSVTVDQPAYVGEPIWIHTEPLAKVHYPFRTGIGDFGCNRLELMRAGKLIPARRLELWDDQNGALCGWVAPPKAPAGRLPLHIWFPSLRPGKYAVRWISQTPDFSNHKLHFSNGKLQMIEVASEWTTFPVRMAPPGQRERWLSDLLAHVPPDPGMLAEIGRAHV